MQAPELQALRRLLFFSAAEAARHLAADEERPQGVEERTWNRWEAGKMPVPGNVADAVRQAVAYRSEVIETLTGELMAATLPPVTLWYAEQDDWPGPAVLWRPHQAGTAAVVGDAPGRLRLVAFDARSYSLWRRDQGAADTPATRLAWAVAHGEDTPPTR